MGLHPVGDGLLKRIDGQREFHSAHGRRKKSIFLKKEDDAVVPQTEGLVVAEDRQRAGV